MAWDEEWAAARAGSADTPRARQAPAGTGLTVHQDDLGAVGHDAFVLHGQLARKGDHARPATHAAAVALTGANFSSGAQLMTVQDRWRTQLRTLTDACAQISNHLDFSARTHRQNDADITGRLTSVSTINSYFN